MRHDGHITAHKRRRLTGNDVIHEAIGHAQSVGALQYTHEMYWAQKSERSCHRQVCIRGSHCELGIRPRRFRQAPRPQGTDSIIMKRRGPIHSSARCPCPSHLVLCVLGRVVPAKEGAPPRAMIAVCVVVVQVRGEGAHGGDSSMLQGRGAGDSLDDAELLAAPLLRVHRPDSFQCHNGKQGGDDSLVGHDGDY